MSITLESKVVQHNMSHKYCMPYQGLELRNILSLEGDCAIVPLRIPVWPSEKGAFAFVSVSSYAGGADASTVPSISFCMHVSSMAFFKETSRKGMSKAF